MTGLPFVGDVINARRGEGFTGFNRAAFDEGLAPIGQTTGNVVQEQGVEAAQNAVGNGFDNALSGVRLQADAPFVGEMRPIIARGASLPEPMAGNANYTLNTRVGNSFGPNGELSGNDFQQSLRGLRRDANAVSDQPYGYDFGQITNDASGALRGIVQRQSPDTLPAYDAANQAFRNTEVLRDAVAAARGGTMTGETGVFSPAQLGTAANSNARRFGNSHGTTNQPFFDLARAGQTVLPSKIGDSGTAGRLAVASGLAGLGLGGGAGVSSMQGGSAAEGAGGGLAMGLGGAGLLALGGSRSGQRILAHLLADRPDLLAGIGQQVNRRAAIGGMFGAGASPVLLQGQ